jgi:hypothetical protein
MKRILLAGTFLAAFGSAPVWAQTACVTDAAGNTVCDPTSFHVTGPGATGTDPVVLHDSTTFTVDEVGNHVIDPPTTIYFATVVGQTGPTVTSYSFDGGASVPFVGSLSNEGIWTPTNGAGGDLYSFVGCTGCDGSLNKTNVDAIETLLGFGAGQTFQVNNLVLPIGWTGAPDSLTVNGSFSLGTIIAPLASNVELLANGHTRTTFFDTSWTNTGVIGDSVVVPEPSTWAMGLIGFGLMTLFGWKARKSPRYLEA